MPCIKVSVLLFYRRIFTLRPRVFQVEFWLTSGYVVLWFISMLVATILQCKHVSDNWDTQTDRLAACPNSYFNFFRIAALLNTLSDVAVLAIPWPIIWNLQLRTAQKFVLSMVFLSGSL